jgi:hypothetical protein
MGATALAAAVPPVRPAAKAPTTSPVPARSLCSSLAVLGDQMSAKNTRLSAGLDFQCSFAAHLEANQRAQEWAAKCLAYRSAGKTARARFAQRKARFWLKKAMILEGRTDASSLFGGLQGFAALNDDE